LWRCKCINCSIERNKRATDLMRNKGTSCSNCKKYATRISLGDKFGFWTVKEVNNSHARCKCICGLVKKVKCEFLTQNRSTSCGCQAVKTRKQTNLEKYGVEHYSQTKEFNLKTIEANFKKFGVEYPVQSDQVKEKMKQTNLKRFGVKYAAQSDQIKEKMKQTNLEKFGTEYIFQSDKIKEKITQTNLQRYGTSSPMKNSTIRTKVVATNLERYGVECPLELEEIRLKGIETNIEKYGGPSPMASDKVRRKAKKSHDALEDVRKLSDGSLAYEYCNSCKMNRNSRSYAYVILDLYGEESFKQYCQNYIGPKIYYTTEQTLLNILISDFPNLNKFNKQPLEFKYRKKPDFRIEENNKILYINTDGLYDHSEIGRRKLDKNYHFNLQQNFEKNDQAIFQFREDELRTKPEIIRSIILNYFGMNKEKYSGRQLEVTKVSAKQAQEFFNKNHLMNLNPSTTYGLFTKDKKLISCMSIKKHKKDNSLEIVRFASLINSSVRGGFSKLLKYIIKLYSPTSIISFCDMRYSTGKSYEFLGFKIESTTLSWKWTNGRNTFNRLKCRANMDNRGLSQIEHAIELKWYKIYDAGQRKYIKRLKI